MLKATYCRFKAVFDINIPIKKRTQMNELKMKDYVDKKV